MKNIRICFYNGNLMFFSLDRNNKKLYIILAQLALDINPTDTKHNGKNL